MVSPFEHQWKFHATRMLDLNLELFADSVTFCSIDWWFLKTDFYVIFSSKLVIEHCIHLTFSHYYFLLIFLLTIFT